jgi:hypothetical protein
LHTLAAIEGLYGMPLVTKNVWNCFRVRYLAGALRRARFLWIRRDIADAAISDLEARYLTKGTSNSWNSATPANYEALMARPPTEQVVENQYEFNRAIGDSLSACAVGRFAEIWYEDFLADPADALTRAGALLGFEPRAPLEVKIPRAQRSRTLGDGDAEAVRRYLQAEISRLAAFQYRQPAGKLTA